MNRYKVMLAGASVMFCGLVWAIPSLEIDENPIPEIPVGYAKVLSVEGDGVARTLGVGKTQPGAKVWSNDYVKAELYATSIADSQSVPLAVTGKKQTSSSQSFTVYAGSSKISDVGVDSIVADGVTSTATDCGDVYLSYGRFQVLSNELGKAVLWNNLDMFMTEEEDVAKIVKYGNYVAVSNAVCDGEADVVLVTKDSPSKVYRYGVRVTTVTIEKTVVPSADANDKSNATIRIVTHVLNKPKSRPPKVLFFGTSCHSHGLTAKEMANALNAIKDVGPVDWYLFQNSKEGDNGLADHDSIEHKGTAIAESRVSAAFDGSQHYSLKAFYHWFNVALTNAVTTNKYDYIVIETDGTRLAGEYGSSDRAGGKTVDSDLERRVATLLKPFYDNDKVIWIMDDGYDYDIGRSSQTATTYRESPTYWSYYKTDHPDFDLNKIFIYGTAARHPKLSVDTLYRPNNAMMKNSGEDNQYIEVLNDVQLKGLLGILCPEAYLSGRSADTEENVDIRYKDSSIKTGSKLLKSYTSTSNQIFYGHADEIGSKLKEIIKPVAYETEMADTVLNLKNLADVDTIVIPNGLDSVRLYNWSWPSGKSPIEVDPTKWQADVSGWAEDTAKTGLSIGGFTVSNQVQNITNDCWRKVEIGIQFKPDFLKTAKAKKEADPSWPGIEWNDVKKVYEVNPNDGEAVVTLWRGGGESRVKCMATAQATALALEMQEEENEFDIRRADDAVKVYDGISTNIVIEVKDPPEGMTIKYRNKGGKDTEWKEYTPAAGYVNVADSTNVEFKVEAEGYKTYVGTNDVRITAAEIKKVGPSDPTDPSAPPMPEPPTDGSPWVGATNVVKTYDGKGTNILAVCGNLLPENVTRTILYSTSPTGPFASRIPEQFVTVTNVQVYFTVEAPNYLLITNSAWVTIKPLDQNEGPGDPRDNGVFAKDQSMTFGGTAPDLTGQYTVGGGFLKGDGVKSVDLVFTNGTDVTKLPKDVYPNIISTNDAVVAAIVVTNATGDVTKNYKIRFTPGTLTIRAGGMTIGPGNPPNGPVTHPPAGQPPIPPADPKDELSWTNGARSVTKTYDGQPTNIVVSVLDPSKGATIEYSYDKENWYPSSTFPGYTTVTNKATVWFKIEALGYQTITNRAFVTIEKKNLGGGGGGGDENAIVADDKSIAYGGTPTLTWRGGKGLVDGDGVKSVDLALATNVSASVLVKGVYQNLISTNATVVQAIVITNSFEVDVTDCYEGFFTPGKLTVVAGGMVIGPEGPAIYPPQGEDPLPPAEPGDDPAKTGARSVTKTYDGKATNIVVTTVKPSDGVIRYSYDGTNFVDASVFEGYTTVTNLAPVWFEVTDPAGNYQTITNRAFVTIEKKNLGGGGGGGDENAIVADDKSIAYGGTPTLTWRGGKGLVDGDGVKSVDLALATNVSASVLVKGVYPNLISTNATVVQAIVITNSFEVDVTDCYEGFFTPGKLTVVAGGMVIGPEGPAIYPPQGEDPLPPAEPGDDPAKTGARSVTKTYDGKATNIVVTTVKPADGVVRYSYDGTNFYNVGEFPGYTTVTNLAPVWFEVTDPAGNYQTITNRAFVTIEKKNLGGGGGGDDNAIVADDKSIAYGEACPTLTWHGGKGLAPGDSIKTVSLALKDGAVASTLPKGVYSGLITTNAAVVIVNSKGADVTDCYEGFFTPGTLTVNSATIRYEVEVPNVPYDGKGTNITVKLISVSDPPFILKYRGPDTPEGVWLDEPPVYTNASPYDITYMIVDGDNFTPVSNTVTMIISPRKITLKSPKKDKIYDGKPLKLLADEIAAGGMGFADGERFDFANLAEITLPGTVKATFTYGDGTAKLANYEVTEVEYGKLIVNPNDEQIVVRSASGTWTYDGNAHSTNDFAIVGEKNLYEGDWVLAELKLNTVTTPDEGDVTNEFKTVEIYRGPKGDVSRSTKVTVEYKGKLIRDEGILNVVNAKFTEPAVTPYRGIYDGNDHSITVVASTVPVGSDPSGTATVTYPDGNTFRDVTNAVVRFTIKAKYYDDYESESTVEILPREVVFTTGDDTKKFGETARTPADIKVEGDGFVGTEKFSVTTYDQRTEVGRSDAGFEYELSGGAKSCNYKITMLKGALTVYDDTKLTVIATNAVHVFDGNAYSNHGVTITNLPAGCTVTPTFADSSVITYPGEVANRIASVKITKGGVDVTAEYETVLIDGKLKVVAAKLVGGEVVSTNVVYDGKGHSIKVTPPTFKGTGPATIYYSTTGWEGPYQTENPSFTLADPKGTPNVVYVRISVPGYEDYYTNGYVTVTRRPVTIASASAEKVYDGIPLTSNDVKVVGTVALADGDALVAGTTASQTNAGQTDNAFDYKIMDAATKSIERTKNYHVTIENGALTVNQAPIPPWNPKGPGPGPGPGPGDEPDGPWVWLDDATMVYTGETGTNVAVTSGHFADGLPKLEYRPEGMLRFLPFAQAFTNVMYDGEGNYRSTNVTVRFTGDSNYLSTNLTAKVTILPGSIELGPDGPAVYPPAGQPPMPPADPDDPSSWTNGARSVTKTYDGLPTNIVVTVEKPTSGATIEYSYDKTTWLPYDAFPGYTEVTNTATVWFKIEAQNYQPITNCAFVTIKPKSLGPGDEPGINIPQLPDTTYNGDPYEPEVVVTNGVTGLIPGKDYTITYVSNTNATGGAYVIITGIGNYGGVHTNYFKILPRSVTIRSCSTEKYLSVTGGAVVVTNPMTELVEGSFVTNAVTGLLDGYVANVTGRLESAVPAEADNIFTVSVNPGLATNYVFTYEYGKLVIKDPPAEKTDVTDEVPDKTGKGVITIKMDNSEAGPWATDIPPELRDIAAKETKGPGEKILIRLKVGDTNHWNAQNWAHYQSVTGEIVKAAQKKSERPADIARYEYDAFDITLERMYWAPSATVAETNDIGHVNDVMLTIQIPYTFKPKLRGLSVWRNHTWTNNLGVIQNTIEELGMNSAKPGAAYGEYYTTNDQGVVLHATKFSEYVIQASYRHTPQLKGSIKWKFSQQETVFCPAIDVTCYDGDPALLKNLCFVYEDREDYYLRNPAIGNANKLSLTSGATYDGKKFGVAAFDSAWVSALASSPLMTTKRYGVSDATLADKDNVVHISERLIKLATPHVKELVSAQKSGAVLDKTLGYLTWKEEGSTDTFWCALGEDMDPLIPTTAQTGVPRSLSAMSRMVTLGLSPTTEGSKPTLEIGAFEVGETTISGTVMSKVGDQSGVPGANASVTLLGDDSPVGEYDKSKTPLTLNADGSFSVKKPNNARFFKVSVEVVETLVK